MARGMRLERFMLGMIAAQQTRPARTGGEALLEAGGERFVEGVGACESEIVVRGEVDALSRRESAAAVIGRERGKIGVVGGEGRVWHYFLSSSFPRKREPSRTFAFWNDTLRVSSWCAGSPLSRG